MTMLTHPNDDAASVERDEREVFALLQSLDEPARPVRVGAVIARARGESRTARYRLAASILLTVTAAGVAYAMPGLPVKEWIHSMMARVTREAPAARQAVQVPGATSGIAVAPGERFVIRFAAASPNGEALVSFTDDSTISVRAALGGATFTSESDRLVIEPRGSAISVEIAIPRSAPRVEIQVAGERVFLKDGMRVTALEAPGARERYRIALTTSRR